MRFKEEKQICVLNLDGHLLIETHFKRLRNGRYSLLAIAVEPSVPETREQVEVIAFFSVSGMR